MKRDRRQFLSQVGLAGLGGIFYTVPGLFAQELAATPAQTEGPYYPRTLPLDTDNDLLVINDNITPAVGTILHLSGRVLDRHGNPIRNALVEIWQADNSGAYVHPSSNGYARRDVNFQGFGRFETGSRGEYLFRTVKPGLYTGRTRHIHFKVKAAGRRELTSQLYFDGEPANARDRMWNPRLTVQLSPAAGSTVGALSGDFDIVL
jgi:protocatechuate 3,4-dioxygenase beta subunit